MKTAVNPSDYFVSSAIHLLDKTAELTIMGAIEHEQSVDQDE
jgi:hypothetical protein